MSFLKKFGKTTLVALLATTVLATSVATSAFAAPSKTSGTTINPSNLKDWYVYDSYYHPDWTGLTNTSTTAPDGWTDNSKHPFSYYKESAIGFREFIDFNSAGGYEKFVNTVLKGDKFTNGSETVNQTAYFSNHIFTTTDDESGSTIHFVGYGVDARTDFAIADITDDRVKTIGFDIDINGIFAHSMNGYGIFVNAGVDKATGMLKAYAVYIKFNKAASSLYLVDMSGGINANNLHRGTPASILDYAAFPKTLISSLDLSLENNPTGKKRLDIEFDQENLKVKASTYTTPTTMSTDFTSNNLTMKDTKFQGFGPFLDHLKHDCVGLTYITFSGVVCTVNYSVLFDNNFGEQTEGVVPANVARVDDLEPGEAFGAEYMPSDPQREGYVFDGWYTTDDVLFNGDSIVNGTQTVYAKWLKEYKIIFDTTGNGDGGTDAGSDGGTDGGDDGAMGVDGEGGEGGGGEIVLEGKNPTGLPPINPQPNYEFVGWMVNDDPSKYYTSEEIMELEINGDIKITAVYQEQPKVTFEGGANGSLEDGDKIVHVPTGQQVASGDIIPQPVANTNYEFAGWAIKGDNSGTLYSNEDILNQVMSGNITFEAMFTKIKSPITYDVSEGGKIVSGMTEYPDAELGEPLNKYTLPTVEPEDKTYEFTGWFDKNGNKIDPDKDLVSMDTGSITAVFAKKESFSLTFAVKSSDSDKGTIADPATFPVYKSADQEVVAGDAENFAVPSVQAKSNYVFYGWEDENGKLIDAADIADIKITANTTLYARFEEDKDGDGCADKDQSVITVKFAVDSPGTGTLSGTDTFQILLRNDGGQTLLSDAIAYGSNVFTAVPGVTSKSGMAFDTWLDPNGNEILDPASIDLNQFANGETTITFKAAVSLDENGDNIADKHQYEYTLTFNADPAKFIFTNMQGSSKTYRFLGGDKRTGGEAPTLGLSNLLGGASSYVIPVAGKKPGNTEFSPGSWEFAAGSSIANLQDPKLNQSTEYTIGEIPNYYTVKFMVNGTQHEIVTGITNAQMISDQGPVAKPANNGAKVFEYWVGSDGKSYTHEQAMAYQPNRDMVFTAMFRTVGITIKL